MKDQTLEHIISDVSHDLQSKIMSIKAQVYLARHNKGDLNKVEGDLQQLSYLLDDLTTLLIIGENQEKLQKNSVNLESFFNISSTDFSFDLKIDKEVSKDYLVKINQDLLNWFLKIFAKYLILKNFEQKAKIIVTQKEKKVEIKYQLFENDQSFEKKPRLESFYWFALQQVAKLMKISLVNKEDGVYSLMV